MDRDPEHTRGAKPRIISCPTKPGIDQAADPDCIRKLPARHAVFAGSMAWYTPTPSQTAGGRYWLDSTLGWFPVDVCKCLLGSTSLPDHCCGRIMCDFEFLGKMQMGLRYQTFLILTKTNVALPSVWSDELWPRPLPKRGHGVFLERQ